MDVPTFSDLVRALPQLKEMRLERIALGEDAVTVDVAAARPRSPCPRCRRPSRHVHSRYGRTVADLPWSGVRVVLRVTSRRFRCRNAACVRTVFCERLPALVPVYGRRTHQCREALVAVGVALGGRPGVRLAARLRLAGSRTTLVRLVRHAPDRPDPPWRGASPRVLGVDEWAFRRGPRQEQYGAVLVDLERHRPVDLLRAATADGFAAWLRAHPGAEVISRDRGGAFAEAARRVAPDAVQVADRFHLLHNMGDALRRVFQRHAGDRRRVPAPVRPGAAGSPAPAAPGHVARGLAARPERADRRAARERTRRRMQEQHEAIQQLAATGMSISAIARALGIHRHTVQHYIRLPAPPERRHVWRRPGILAPYVAHLLERWRQGCRNAMQLWREVAQRGFGGEYKTVARQVAHWKQLERAGRQVPPPPHGLTPRQATALFLLLPPRRTAEEQRAVDQVHAVHPEVCTAAGLFGRFAALLREAGPAAASPTERKARLARLDRWLSDATRSGLAEFGAFATKLRQDLAAVQAALTLPYSQGQTEGQITRLKALKRQMFGRANFDLLRRRFLATSPAAT